MYGLVGIIFGSVLHSVVIYAIGWGLFIDELTYILMRGKTHDDNYSKVSLLGTLGFVIVIFFIKDYLLALIR